MGLQTTIYNRVTSQRQTIVKTIIMTLGAQNDMFCNGGPCGPKFIQNIDMLKLPSMLFPDAISNFGKLAEVSPNIRQEDNFLIHGICKDPPTHPPTTVPIIRDGILQYCTRCTYLRVVFRFTSRQELYQP